MRRVVVACAVIACALTVTAQQSHQRISLWPNGAPGSEARRNEREQAKDYSRSSSTRGPLAVPSAIPASAPPTFLLAAADDPCCAGPTVKLLQLYREAGVSVEAHMPAKGVTASTWGSGRH
jgi:acetyl esterase/lipase